MKIKVYSFAWKNGGPPADAGLVIDCRDMRNPHSHADLRPLTGKDAAVQDFVVRDTRFKPNFDRALHEAGFGNHIAFGCFGGRHRSVAMAEIVAKELQRAGGDVEVKHLVLG